MKKVFTFLTFMMMTIGLFAQSSITGRITDGEEALIGASVQVQGTTLGTITDIDGYFTLANMEDGDQVLIIKYIGFDDMLMPINVTSGAQDLGTISMESSGLGLDEVVVTGVMDVVRDRRTPVAVSTINVSEIQAKAVGNVEFPEIMKNTPSLYVSNQTGFGDSQMFMRGFGQSNTAFLLNGQPINGMEDGRMYWSNWSGMSDVASAVQIQRGLGSSKLAISSVGGTVNIVTKTTENKEGGFARFMVGNDAYLKGTVAYNTGLKGKWAMSLLVDHWQADNKWAEGTKGQGQNYFLSVGFKPNDRHDFNFLVTGAPQNHGQRWSQDSTTLVDNPKFNQHWNEYDGEFISERFNYYHKPILNLNWDFKIDANSSLSSVAYASFGRGGGTGDYGGFRPRDENGRRDFEAIADHNMDDDDGIGTFGDNYARRASVNNHQWFGNVTSYKRRLNEQVNLSVGADLRWYKGDHFRQLVDLFGLDGWNESFRHSARPSDYVVTETFSTNPWSALSNFASEDQRIAYDYSENINYQGVFGQVEYTQPTYTTFLQAAVSNQSYQREGRWSDIGESDKINKIGYNVKGGASVNVNDNNILFANAGYYSRQPFLDNIFSNIRYSNNLVEPEVDNEDVIGLELGYKFFNGNFSANVNLYRTTWGNRTLVSTFDNDNGTEEDESDDFTQRNVERGIEQRHMGIEADLKYRIESVTVKGYFSIGNWEYTEIGSIQAFNDDTGVEIANQTVSDISGVHVPNAPQTSLGLGVDYNIQGFNIFADLNFYDRIYKRNNFDADDIVLRRDIGTLDSYILLDMGVGYTYELANRQNIGIRANVYNVADNFYFNQTDPYGFLNGNGRTWNLSLKYSF